jgi:hypothetical protein
MENKLRGVGCRSLGFSLGGVERLQALCLEDAAENAPGLGVEAVRAGVVDVVVLGGGFAGFGLDAIDADNGFWHGVSSQLAVVNWKKIRARHVGALHDLGGPAQWSSICTRLAAPHNLLAALMGLHPLVGADGMGAALNHAGTHWVCQGCIKGPSGPEKPVAATSFI